MGKHYPETEPLLAETKKLLRRSGLQAKKKLGQHFLTSGTVLEDILTAAELTPEDTVLEIGPGSGVLTRELAKRAGRVTAVELDSKLAAALKKSLASASNLTIINQDILRLDPQDLLAEHGAKSSYKLVANLPYYITAPILRHFLEASLKPELMVIMVQKEVAAAINATPGKMSLLAISVQFYGKPEIVSYVPAYCFYPPPEVDSAILKITPYPQPPVAVSDVTGFFETVRAGFTAPRKQLANSLALGLGTTREAALSRLEKAGIESRRRAETLSLEEWARLWQIFDREKENA